jgi:hypothetical protein
MYHNAATTARRMRWVPAVALFSTERSNNQIYCTVVATIGPSAFRSG